MIEAVATKDPRVEQPNNRPLLIYGAHDMKMSRREMPIIPATSDPEHLIDNMGAGVGRLPDERTRRRMEQLFDGL